MIRNAVAGVAILFVLGFSSTASAHLATFGSWETTQKYLKQLFPEAEAFRVKSDAYSDREVAKLETALGFNLYPEDKNPKFYLALKGKKLLGVAIFIDPRLQGETDLVRLEVGVAVDRRGKVASVRLFEYRGDEALKSPLFLNQFVGMADGANFDIPANPSLTAADGMKKESQLVANAAREALLLIKTSLARK